MLIHGQSFDRTMTNSQYTRFDHIVRSIINSRLELPVHSLITSPQLLGPKSGMSQQLQQTAPPVLD